ncbi:hypothetical protein [Amycolatopsis sp. cg13]|uniref:hypothetical protein n=1 Tax=Amycolatopsis sp. cg13 TaxID=3238807 RepID=UPI0035252167
MREVEEETGWRPRTSEPLASLQPNVGVADNENLLFLSRGAECLCRTRPSGVGLGSQGSPRQ